MAETPINLDTGGEHAQLRMAAETLRATPQGRELLASMTPSRGVYATASASGYRPGVRTAGYASGTDTKRAAAKRYQGGGGNRHLTPGVLSGLRNTGRDMMRNNPVARALVKRAADFVIGGKGLRLQCTSSDKAFNAYMEFRWYRWLNSAVASRRMGGLGFQRWLVGQPIIAGDGFVVKYGGDAPPEIAGRIHLVEAEQVDAGPQSGFYPYGVERTEWGELSAIWVRQFGKAGQPLAPQRVEAVNVLAIETIDAVGRVSCDRGEPELASIVEVYDGQFDLYQSNIDAAQLAASMGLVTKTESPKGFEKAMLGERKLSGNGSSGQALEPGESKYVPLEPGVNMVHVGQSDAIESLKSEYPAQSVTEFGEAMQGIGSAVCGIPVNILMLTFASMNYSSGRMAIYVAAECCKPFRAEVVRLLSDLYEWKQAVFAFDFVRERKAMGFKDAVLPVDWRLYKFPDPPLPSLDPLKDVQAAQLRVQSNFTSKHDECEGTFDTDFDQVAEERKAEVELEAEYGITPPLAPGANSGGQPDGGRSGEADQPASGSGQSANG